MKYLFLAALSLSSDWALAAGKKTSDQATGSPLTQYAASTAPLTLEIIAARFAEVDARIQTLSADFKQFVRLEGTDTVQQVEGGVLFRKPDLMRLTHRLPEAQTLVSDGVFFWVYRPATNQVIQTRLESWRKKEPMAKGLLDFGKSADLLKRYHAEISSVSAPGSDGHRNIVVTLTPKPSDMSVHGPDFTLSLKMSDRDFFPTDATLRVGRASIRSTFDKIRVNPDIRDETFRFSPPAGSDVFSTPETP